MAQKRRAYRVGEMVREVVAAELHRMADPRLDLVTITSAVMSPDLRHAKVYWMVHGDEERREEVTEAFGGASGHFRKLVAKALGVKFVPDLRFYYDDTLDAAEEIDRLLQRAKGSD